jgi:hypothetical protein
MPATSKPCGQCPFKKNSIKGYLGGFTIEETLETAKSEHSFICHKTRETPNQKECSGRLLFASKVCKSFKNPELEKLRLEAKENNSTENILGFDFKEHHK